LTYIARRANEIARKVIKLIGCPIKKKQLGEKVLKSAKKWLTRAFFEQSLDIQSET
jgi:hypothetical protein